MITIVSRPERFSPASNNIIFQIETNNADIVYFRVKLYDDDSTSVINVLDVFPTPATPLGSYINFSKMLTSAVNWEINNDLTTLVVPMYKTVRAYRLKITERILDATTNEIIDGDEYDDLTDVSYVFNAELGRITAHNYRSAKYLINPTTIVSFLTNKPNFSKTNNVNAEHLYFLQNGTVQPLLARIRTFGASGTLLSTNTELIVDLDTYRMYRLNISPKALKQSNGISFASVAYYVVDIIDGVGIAKTEERVYYYENTECYLDYVNLLWVNSLGGIDSYQFIAPQDSINVTRTLMKRNINHIDSDGIYNDIDGGVYNPSDVILDNSVSTITKVYSKELTDKESYWLIELFSSKQIFIELTDSTLATALLNNTNYQIPRLKYVKGTLNTINIEFTMSAGIIPTGSHGYSTHKSTIEFIDSQMNAIQFNLPGYGVTLTGEGDYSDTDYDVQDYG